MTASDSFDLTRAIEATLNTERPYGAASVHLRDEVDPDAFAKWLIESVHDSLVTCDVFVPQLLRIDLLHPTDLGRERIDGINQRILADFTAMLASQQKPFRSASKIGDQYAQMRAGKNPNQKRLDAMLAEYEGYVAAGVAAAAPILPTRRAEEYFRAVPRVYELADATAGLPSILRGLLLTDKWNPAHCFTRDRLIYTLTMA